MIKHTDLTIELEKQEDGNWTGGVSIKDEGDVPLIGFPKTGEFGDYLSVVEYVPENQRENKEGQQFGFFNFKERKRKSDQEVFQTMYTRSFKYRGLNLPLQGIVNDRGEKPFVKLKFDNYYYDTQRKFWEKAGHEYVFESDATVQTSSLEEECPF